jgi:hypothetical protein
MNINTIPEPSGLDILVIWLVNFTRQSIFLIDGWMSALVVGVTIYLLIFTLIFKTFLSEDKTIGVVLIRLLSGTAFWLILAATITVVLTLYVGIRVDVSLYDQFTNQHYKGQLKRLTEYPFYHFVALSLSLSLLTFVYIKGIVEKQISLAISRISNHIPTDYRPPELSEIPKLFPPKKKINLRRLFRKAGKNKKIVIGLDKKGLPILVPLAYWKKSNSQTIGVPGAGKGVSVGVQLYQTILLGNVAIVLNPKEDEWAYSVYLDACKKAGQKLIYLDCNLNQPSQINILKNINAQDLFELFVSLFDLSRTGAESDFYRSIDRRMADELVAFMFEGQSELDSEISFGSIVNTAHRYFGDRIKQCPNFINNLEEIASVEALNGKSDINLEDILSNGGCIFVQGSTDNEVVQLAVKSVLIRLLQLTIRRTNKSRHVAFFCDEVKYLMCHTLLNALGTVRDKNANILLAHQTLGDMVDNNIGLDPAAMRETIIGNTPMKWIYRSPDFDTATWVSNLTGFTSGFCESIETFSNTLGTEGIIPERRLTCKEFNNVHTNVVQNLPHGYAVCVGASEEGYIIGYSQTLDVEKVEPKLIESPSLCQIDRGDLL